MILLQLKKLIKTRTRTKTETKVETETLKTELQEKCINYISGKNTDQDFNSRVEELSKQLDMSKYEVIEYILDQQENLQK